MSEADLTAAYEANFERLVDFLERNFSRLGRAGSEDLVQRVMIEALCKVRSEEGFQPDADWPAWLRWACKMRALDFLRCHERASLVAIASGSRGSVGGVVEAREPHPSPSRVLLEAERRGRQTLVLSQVFREFCQRCEQRGMHQHKEVYERSLRGQKPDQIAAATGLTRNNVDQHLKRARDWILARVREEDVDRSLFATLHRQKGQREKSQKSREE
jgi:RNA polymerase sigma factor (sigma-70 family)